MHNIVRELRQFLIVDAEASWCSHFWFYCLFSGSSISLFNLLTEFVWHCVLSLN